MSITGVINDGEEVLVGVTSIAGEPIYIESGEKEIYWVSILNETTYEEVWNEIKSGKLVKAYSGHRHVAHSVEFTYLTNLGGYLVFYALGNPFGGEEEDNHGKVTFALLDENNEWSYVDRYLVPDIPSTGTYTLKSINGTLTWVED